MGQTQSGVTQLAVLADGFVIPDALPEEPWDAIGRVLRCDADAARRDLTDPQSSLMARWVWQAVRDARSGSQPLKYDLPDSTPEFARAAAAVFGDVGAVTGGELVLKAAPEEDQRQLRENRMQFDRKDGCRRALISMLADLSYLVYELDEDRLEGECAAEQWKYIMRRRADDAETCGKDTAGGTNEQQSESRSSTDSSESLRTEVTGRLQNSVQRTLYEHALNNGCSSAVNVSDTKLIEFQRTDEGLQAALLVSESTRHVFVVFRGTDEFSDFLHDLSVARVDAYQDTGVCLAASESAPEFRPVVQSGFFEQYASGMHREGDERPLSTADPAGILALALDLLEDKPDWHVLVGGHSLGGALATLFTLDLARRTGRRNIFLATFGSPRVGNSDFRAEFELFRARGMVECWRCQFEDDIVTRVPAVGYAHVGTHVWVIDDYAVEVRDDGTACASWHPLCDPCRLRPCAHGAGDHGMRHYLAALHDTSRLWLDRRQERPSSFDRVLRKCDEPEEQEGPELEVSTRTQ